METNGQHSVTDHKLNGLNEALSVTALGKGSGGADTSYLLTLPDWTRNPDGSSPHHVWQLDFQNGPVQSSADFNGLTNEALLAVLIDRMRGFQSGPFTCRENAVAMTKLEEALMWLQKRTRERLARGVEGSHKP